jgi:hypothetical protein
MSSTTWRKRDSGSSEFSKLAKRKLTSTNQAARAGNTGAKDRFLGCVPNTLSTESLSPLEAPFALRVRMRVARIKNSNP